MCYTNKNRICVIQTKIDTSDVETPQSDHNFDVPLCKLKIDACNSTEVILFIRQMT